MELTTIRELYKNSDSYMDQKVTIGGWVRSIRGSKAFGFIVVNDGTFFEPLQVVYHDKMDNFAEISKLNVGAAVIVTGTLVATPQAKQPFEIQADTVEVEGASAPDYPLQKKRHSFEYLRTIAHLRPRTNTFQAVFRVRSLTAYAIHKFFQERGFVYVHTPLITGSDCEGAGEMFQVTTLDMNNLPMTEDGKVDYSRSRNLVLTSVVFVTGLSGIALKIGNVEMTGMVLACVVAMAMSLVFYILDKFGLTNDQPQK